MSTDESSQKKGVSLGDKIRGAARIAHGFGEDIRGTVLGAVDSISGSNGDKAKGEDIVAKGKAEIERGIAQMKGVESTTAAPVSAAEDTTGKQPQEQQQPPDASRAQPSSPAESQQVKAEAKPQEPSGQTQAENIAQAVQETQPASGTEPQISSGEAVDAPRATRSSA